MPRRVATYIQDPEWQTLNRWATAGAFLMGISTIFFLVERRLLLLQARAGRRQPLGRPDARVVHDLAAAAPQLLRAAADPLGATDLGLQPP